MSNQDIKKNSLYAMIDNNVADVEIPEGIKPDNMMKHIKELKSEGYFEESRQVDESVDEEEKNWRRKKTIGRITRWGSIAVAAVFTVVIAGVVIYNNIPKKGEYNIDELKEKVVAKDDSGANVLSGYKELTDYIVSVESFEVTRDREYDAHVMDWGTNSDGLDWNSVGNGSFDESSGAENNEYYETNSRTDGVTEADVAKTDGNYIYYLRNEKVDSQLVIVKADGEASEILSTIEVRDDANTLYCKEGNHANELSAEELFVYGDKVAVIMTGTTNQNEEGEREERTAILVYDVANRTEPQLMSRLYVDGTYESSRMVDGYIYLFTNRQNPTWKLQYESYTEEEATKYMAPKVCGEYMKPKDIYVSDGEEYDMYSIIATMDMNNSSEFKDAKAILGESRNLKTYVSNNNIYIISEHYIYDEYRNAMREVKEFGETTETTVMGKTEIAKLSYKDGIIEGDGRCIIEGNVGDEFDIDEYNGYLRIAVTVEERIYKWEKVEATYFDGAQWIDCIWVNTTADYEWSTASKLYVLDENLKMVGGVVLQQEESVYGVRFDGDIGYVVTYRETDPLFTVDLSNPTNPKIMGELKIPGFSNYLHIWDENTLIGLGYISSSFSSLKISVFDISDKFNVTEKGVFKLPTNGRSLAPYNHKEIFISPEKKLIGFWMQGDFIINEEKCDAIYQIFSFDNGEIVDVLRCPVSGDYIEDTRGMYIGEYIYIVSPMSGVFVYDMATYTQVAYVQ